MLLRASELKASRGLLRLADATRFDGATLREWDAGAALNRWRKPLRGRRIALIFEDNFLLALTLLATDGVAARLAPVPSGLSPTEIVELTERVGAEFILTDRTDLPVSCASFYALPPMPSPGEPLCPVTPVQVVVTEWILTTSGTTRTPEPVTHTVASLTRTVRRDPGKGITLVWGLLYDLNRFAGLQVFFQALLGGSLLVIPSREVPLERVVAGFCRAGVNALSATPTLWRKLLMTPGVEVLPLRRITLGGEIADRFVLDALKAGFPGASLTHIYASTEVGVGFSVSDGREGFPAAYLDGGYPGVLLRIGADGVLEVKVSAPGARHLDGAREPNNADGFVSTGDVVRREGDRILFLGRESGAINVGGNKVRPEEIERVLLAHPEVAFAAAGAKRSGITGSLVVAEVVLRTPGPVPPVTASELRAWCVERLDRHKVPALIRLVERLDIGVSGKISRSSASPSDRNRP